jgi:hypothetical protein
MDSAGIIAWTRVSVLILAFGLAAWMDHRERRVPNDFWITWAKPAAFLWTLDLMVQSAEWYHYSTAAAMIAYASIAVIGRPTVHDILAGKSMDIIVGFWYAFGLAGIIQGAMLHGSEGPMEVIIGNASADATLWWTIMAVALPIFLVDMAWRMRLIHGGADCKALMWVSIMVPSWNAVPVVWPESMEASTIAMPPAIALLVWGGFAFLVLPFIMIVKNLKEGGGSLKLIWHAERMPLSSVATSHVWLLTTIAEMPDGTKKIIHRTRAPSKSPSKEKLAQSIAILEENSVETVWVTRKFPLLVFLWPAVLPLVLIGGPMALFMPMLGL